MVAKLLSGLDVLQNTFNLNASCAMNDIPHKQACLQESTIKTNL